MRSDILAGRAYVELLLRDGRFNLALQNASKRFKQFGADMQAMGRTLMAASAAILGPTAAASKVFADFDDKMREVQAVTQATGDDFLMLTERAKDLGASTSFTAIQVAALMAELGRAGFDPRQVEAMTAAVLDLARATATDATLASGIMAAAIRQFGLEANDATRVADALTTAANKSFNTVEQLGEALSYAGPVAADFNMSIEDTLAILGALGNVGIQASSAGTALRRMLIITGAEAEKLKEIFGVTFVDTAGNARPLVDVLAEIDEVTKGMGTAERAKKFNEAFGLLGITGASAVAKNASGVRELREALNGLPGSAARAAKAMDAGLGGALRIMWSAIEGVAIAIGDALDEELMAAANMIERLSTQVRNFVQENEDLVTTVVQVAAGVGAAGAALLGLGLTVSAGGVLIGGLATGLGVLGSMLGSVLTPILAVGTAVTAFTATMLQSESVVTALGMLVESVWQEISLITSSLWFAIGDTVNSALLGIKVATQTVFGWVSDFVTDVLLNLSFVVSNWRLIVESAFVAASAAIVTRVNEWIYLLSVVLPSVLKWFADNWRDIFTTVANFFGTVASNIFKNAQNLMVSLVDLFNGDGFTFEWTPLTDGFVSAIKELPEIAEREIGPLEQSLKDRMGQLQRELAQQATRHLDEFDRRMEARKSQHPHNPALNDPDHPDYVGGGGANAGGGGGGGNLPEMNRQIFATFSAAAAAAQAQGGGSSLDKAAQRTRETQLAELRRMRRAIQSGPRMR